MSDDIDAALNRFFEKAPELKDVADHFAALTERIHRHQGCSDDARVRVQRKLAEAKSMTLQLLLAPPVEPG